jgi:hypothetical protein
LKSGAHQSVEKKRQQKNRLVDARWPKEDRDHNLELSSPRRHRKAVVFDDQYQRDKDYFCCDHQSRDE